jgi:hypothetical protein
MKQWAREKVAPESGASSIYSARNSWANLGICIAPSRTNSIQSDKIVAKASRTCLHEYAFRAGTKDLFQRGASLALPPYES